MRMSGNWLLTSLVATVLGGTISFVGCNKPPATSETEQPAPVAGEKEAAPEAAPAVAAEPAAAVVDPAANVGVGPKDWPQWGGTKVKNNVPHDANIVTEWEPGKFDRKTGEWKKETSKNVKWVARVGSQTYGNPVIANGKVVVGTNNGAGWIKRYPASVDLGCLVCFRESDGEFLWQHSSEKLSTGRVHDWPLQGICCSPLIEGDKLWFVTSRGEVICLDIEGFHDGENDGPVTDEAYTEKDEADVVWSFDMMKELKTSQHNMCSCSVTALGDILFVCTSNGVDESHINLPAPNAPSFFAMNKKTGEVYWTDDSPGLNILHGQWSSPAVGELGGVWQVIFAGGDGWLYSFEANEGKDGKPTLLWKFDANPKETKYILGGAGTRNEIIATPVIYEGLVYLAVGQDPEHGEGDGHLWCIDPTKRGDVSPELAYNVKDLENPIPHRRLQAVIKEEGEVARPNPNSGVVWHYSMFDVNEDGDMAFEETMHRSIGTATIKNGLLVIADFSGLVHCVDAKTGKPHWSYDMLAASWGSALIAGDKVLIGDEDGDVSIFNLSADPEVAMKKVDDEFKPQAEINMGNSVYSSPLVANDVLYVANKTHIFAIQASGAEVAADATTDKPAETSTEAPVPVEEKPAEAAPAEEKPAEEKPAAEETPAEDKPAEEKPAADEASAEDKPATEEKPAADEAPAEDKPAEAAPAEEKPAAEEAPAEAAPAE
jgi:outer membrane protein assembly factor BamB